MSGRAQGVAVVGSANLDVVVRSARQPQPGETLMGDSLEHHPGGKGLNQAIAAARFAPTAFVGAVGADAAGETLASCLTDHGVDTRQLQRVAGSSGTAIITVATSTGENSIVVVDGANAALTRSQVESALAAARPRVVVAQLEVPAPAVAAAAEWAQAHGSRFVFNPSPIERLTESAPADPIRGVVALADPLIVNRGEGLGILAEGGGSATAEEVAIALAGIARSVVVTDGPHGAHVVADGRHHFVEPTAVAAVDTTGAGDSFAGTVAGLISAGAPLPEAAATAAAVAAEVVATPRAHRGPRR